MTDLILTLLVLGAINHQVTHIITTGVILEDFRQAIALKFGPASKMAYLTRCHLCAGSWVGFAIALVAPEGLQITAQPLANFMLVSFAVALVGRIWNEGLALASSKVSEIRRRENSHARAA
jgi:hypothetical protein